MTDRLTLAQARADAARARFRLTLERAKARAKPKSLAQDTALGARRQPVIVAGALTGALLYLFRKPIFGAFSRSTEEKDDG